MLVQLAAISTGLDIYTERPHQPLTILLRSRQVGLRQCRCWSRVRLQIQACVHRAHGQRRHFANVGKALVAAAMSGMSFNREQGSIETCFRYTVKWFVWRQYPITVSRCDADLKQASVPIALSNPECAIDGLLSCGDKNVRA